jgi:Flp pilus assembly protein TadD
MNAAERQPTQTRLQDTGEIPSEVLDICRTTGYELYKARNYTQAELVCRGLVAADDRNWYHHSLLAATLQKMGRFAEALSQIEDGLRCLPGHPRLEALRSAIAESAVRAASRLLERNSDAK